MDSIKMASSSTLELTESQLDISTEQQYRLPSTVELNDVAELPIFDQNGKPRAFRSLWDRKEPTERRNIIIFIRHFLDTSCQEYVRTLSQSISPTGLYLRNPPSTLTIIGCGDPSLIPEYITKTGCKYEIFTDPSHALYTALGMTCNRDMGDKRPNYVKRPSFGKVMSGMKNALSAPNASAGKKSQNGGEWIWVDGELRWARRMKHNRDHVEVDGLKKVLDSQKETGDRDGKYAEGRA